MLYTLIAVVGPAPQSVHRATPLSIASYRMATSPSDQNNRNVIAWLDRLQSSIREAGNHKGPRAFHELRTIDQEDESEPDSEGRRTQAQAAESTVKDNQSVADDVAQDDDKLQSTIPESHVPTRTYRKSKH